VFCEFGETSTSSLALINQAEMPVTNIRIFHGLTTPEFFGSVCAMNG